MKFFVLLLTLFSPLVQARGSTPGEGSIILGLIGLFALLYLFLKLGKGTSFNDSEAIFKGSAIFLGGLVVLAVIIKLLK